MKKIVMLCVIIAVIVLGSRYFSSSKTLSPGNNNRVSTESIRPSNIPSPRIDNSDLKAGGSSYRHPDGLYVLLYPSEYKLDTQDAQHPRIYKVGATQKGQTEMYDGIIIAFEAIDLQGKSLQTWVDTTLKQTMADGVSEIVTPQKNITLNNYPGFTYTIRGLGEATYYALQKNPQSYFGLVITTFVSDPQQLGYQAEVDKILSTLEILK